MKSPLGNEEMEMLLEKAHLDGAGAFIRTEVSSGENIQAAHKAAAESRHRFRVWAEERYGDRKP